MGTNPVTFRGKDMRNSVRKMAMTVLRMHLGFNRDKLDKLVTVAMWDCTDGDPTSEADAAARAQGSVILDEDHVVRGLQELFPLGELNVRQVPRQLVADEALRQAYRDAARAAYPELDFENDCAVSLSTERRGFVQTWVKVVL